MTAHFVFFESGAWGTLSIDMQHKEKRIAMARTKKIYRNVRTKKVDRRVHVAVPISRSGSEMNLDL
jgi:hypothetical protein